MLQDEEINRADRIGRARIQLMISGLRLCNARKVDAVGKRLIVIGILFTLNAEAHDYWGNGREVDRQTKELCCGKNDCKEVAPESMHALPSGIFRFDDTDLVIETDRAMPSPDGRIWRCIWNHQIKCLFVPFSGT